MKDGFSGSRAIILPQPIIRGIENDPFDSKLYITDIGYYPKAFMHQRRRKEGISQYILIYCTDGQGWFELNGKYYDVLENQCFILPANKPHSYGASRIKPWTIYWVHFKGDFASFFATGLDHPVTISPSIESRIHERFMIFEDVFNALGNGYSKNNLDFAFSALYYFLGSIKYIGSFRESNKSGTQDGDIIDQAIAYMKENIQKSISLKQICDFVGYSESHFMSLFKNRTGFTPINYMIQLRMQAACQMLDFTDMRINQVCHKVGISDPYYFSKLFSKTIGVSPIQYKAKKKG